MRILCFIDSLGSGGAQRQLVTLAIGLKKRGHSIRFLVYHPDNHFLPLLQKYNISCHVIKNSSYIKRLLEVRRILRDEWQDVVLAFMESPSFYSEMARLPFSHWGLVVGERLADPGMRNGIGQLLRHLHRFADAVVCNSYTNYLMIENAYPFLKKKCFTIYNTVDLQLFNQKNNNDKEIYYSNNKQFIIVVAASYQDKKNMINLAKALLCLKAQNMTTTVVVDWYGAMPAGSAAFQKAHEFIKKHNIENSFRLHSATKDIASEYSRADVVGLFSFYEGLPNVVCEGMACGKPIIISNVCDASNLVNNGKNGFICDPHIPEDIAEKILLMVNLSEQERQKMGMESRLLAEKLFADEIIVDKYERILDFAKNKTELPLDCNWPEHIPETAYMTVNKWT